MNRYIYFLLLLGTMCLFYTCKKDNPPCITCPPNGQSTVQLKLDYIECKKVWLKLSFTDADQPRGYKVIRDGNQIFTGTMTAVDTLLIDTSVVAGHDYTYIAQRLYSSSTLDLSTPLSVRTLDSTSHNIQWQPTDTLGTMGLIRDVWAFSRDNVWAVGEIYLNDNNGKPDMANPYNVAHWDGNKWNLLKVQFYTFCGQAYTNAYPAYAIWAFSPNDIMIAHYEQVARMNGTTQISTTCLPVSVNKIWGLNSSAVYTVGPLGQIGFWNGSNWTKMTSNTTVDLQDIWGIDATHIWATGTNVGDGHSVVLQFNGSNWLTIYDSNTQPYGFGCLWTNTSHYIYLDGGSGLYILRLDNNNLGSQIKTGLTYVASSIRGINQNDIFDVTTGGEVAHYNGSSWYCYSDIQALNEGGVWWRSIYPKSDIVVIGGLYLTALNGFPVVIRGYR